MRVRVHFVGPAELSSLRGAVMLARGELAAVHRSVHKGAVVADLVLPEAIPSYLVILDWLTAHNVRVLEAARSVGRPLGRLDAKRVRYLAEPRGWEEFADIAIVMLRGHGDCDDLAPAEAATDRFEGRSSVVGALWKPKPGGRSIHIIVETDGVLKDPSERLGMVIPREA